MTAQRVLLCAAAVSAVTIGTALGQAPGGGRGGAPRLVFSVTSPAWPDGGEIPSKNAGGRGGESKSPPFEFHWSLGAEPAEAPDGLKSYAIILHDVDGSTNKTTLDLLHWSAFNIPATAKGLPEGLGAGDLPDGTRNSALARGANPPAYFGPAAGPGPIHHYVFEFYALDTKLDLPANAPRGDLLKAMDGHIIGKASWFGRYHSAQ